MEDFKFKIAGKNYTTKVVEEEGGSLLVTVNGKTYQVEMPGRTPAPKPVIRPAGGVAAAPVAAPAAAAPASDTTVVAPLPGTITKVVAKAGQKVKKGDVLVVMEAMKMANDIVAEANGTVKAVSVSEGQSVNQGDVLIEFQADAVAAPVAAPAPKAAPAPAAAPAPKAAPAGANAVTAPLPGTITQILVKVGQQIKAGDTVVMMEAMKMENSITAEYDGTVKAILVQQGAQVQSGEALVEMA
ncbi:MAG: biotin/lipoyl-containing protein [Bacteroidaceae bacterium]|nr:biotin/lipoyl-containing protein [Bacteroidaceae bacterium]